jgi:hypothetical protein
MNVSSQRTHWISVLYGNRRKGVTTLNKTKQTILQKSERKPAGKTQGTEKANIGRSLKSNIGR